MGKSIWHFASLLNARLNDTVFYLKVNKGEVDDANFESKKRNQKFLQKALTFFDNLE